MGQNNLLSLALWLLPVSVMLNRQLILSSLASEVAAKDGFFNVSVGTYPDQVYALGMCIPGAKQEFCSDCIKAASDQLIQSCPNQAAAFYWSGGGETLCMARYSNSPFLERLAVRMVTAALSSSGKNVPFSNSRFYAADVAALTSSINVYALMQCTPDVSPSNCKTCLRQSVDYYIDCCRGEQGGYVYWPNCLFRLDMYPYNGAFSPLKLAPQPTSQPAFQPASQPAFQPASQPATQPASQLQSPPPLTNEDGKTIDKGAIIGIVAAMLIINM
ncbi:putative cysteine-rich receptor-like protein kinase 30 [Raphanus sativus]|nr:putative cysteine-rich receptor-like protein kinase 30 [Raphanus sativus]